MARRGAPTGNQNAARPWAYAIKRALARNPKALNQIADKLVSAALEGNKDAWKEIGDRLDGRSIQPVTGPGENGEHKLTVEIVKVSEG